MGLVEQIISGSVFTRGTITLSNSPSKGFASAFGASYILLSVSADAPCRVRLYATSQSVAIDEARPTSSFDYSASVALNLDAALTTGQLSLTFNPPVMASTSTLARTWYNIESATSPNNVTFRSYPIELNPASRTILNIPSPSGISLGANATSSGNFTTPKSFVMLSAICPTTDIRLRLYSRPIEDISSAEQSRPFISQSADGSHLISDMLFDSASYLYEISPILQAYNLESYLSASNRVGYIIENTSGASKSNVYAGVFIYPVED